MEEVGTFSIILKQLALLVPDHVIDCGYKCLCHSMCEFFCMCVSGVLVFPIA